MKNLYRIAAVCLAFGLTSVFAGCSISNSVKSSSDSISNSSDSSSNSSSSFSNDDEKDKTDKKKDAEDVPDTSYRDDTRDYTAGYVRSLAAAAAGKAAATGSAAETDDAAAPDAAASGSAPDVDLAAFRKGLSEIAAKYAITNWEGDDETYAGIGLGLAKAGVTDEQIETYSSAFAGGDAAKAASIKRGYGGQS